MIIRRVINILRPLTKMSSLTLAIVKGPNLYTGNLMERETKNINKRKEVNFNVAELGNQDKFTIRSKSFATYREVPLGRRGAKSTDFSSREQTKDVSDDETEEINSNPDYQPEDQVKRTTSGILKKQIKSSERGHEEDEWDDSRGPGEEDETQDSQRENSDDLEEDKDPSSNEENSKGVKNSNGKEDDIGGFDDSVVKGDKEVLFTKYKMLKDKDPVYEISSEHEVKKSEVKVQDIREMIREAFDPKEIRERHERNMERMREMHERNVEKMRERHEKNMEKMREQIQILVDKMAIKKEEPKESKQVHFEDDIVNRSKEIGKVDMPNGFKRRKNFKSCSNSKGKESMYTNFYYDSDDEKKKNCCC